MNNRELAAQKISWARRLPRVEAKEGIILVIGNKGILYERKSGKARRARLVDGEWVFRDNYSISNTTSKYKYCALPNTVGMFYCSHEMNMAVHMLGAIVLGLYDKFLEEELEALDVNHKDYNPSNNTEDNIEVVYVGHNDNHRELKKVLSKIGVYKQGMAWDALSATYILDNSEHDISMISTMAMDMVEMV